MTKDEALDLALEALENSIVSPAMFATWGKYQEAREHKEKAITAIKQVRALDKKAENARELGLDYEPVPENFIDALKFDVAMRDAAPTVQEPVAVYGYCPICGAEGVMRERRPNGYDKCAKGHTYPSSKATPPAAQRQWVGLTDEEMLAVVHYSQLDNARAIEAKLKEKNT